MLISSAFAQTATQTATTTATTSLTSDPTMNFILPMMLVFGIFYFLVIRPQQNKLKAHQLKVSSAKKGDKVVTGGGIEGTIVHVRDDVYEIEIAPNVRIKVRKNTLLDVVTDKN